MAERAHKEPMAPMDRAGVRGVATAARSGLAGRAAPASRAETAAPAGGAVPKVRMRARPALRESLLRRAAQAAAVEIPDAPAPTGLRGHRGRQARPGREAPAASRCSSGSETTGPRARLVEWAMA